MTNFIYVANIQVFRRDDGILQIVIPQLLKRLKDKPSTESRDKISYCLEINLIAYIRYHAESVLLFYFIGFLIILVEVHSGTHTYI